MVRMANQCPWCGADDWGVEESTVFCVACGQIVVGWDGDPFEAVDPVQAPTADDDAARDAWLSEADGRIF